MVTDDSRKKSELSYEELARVYAQALTRLVVMEGGAVIIPKLPDHLGELTYRLHHKVHGDGSIELISIPSQHLN